MFALPLIGLRLPEKIKPFKKCVFLFYTLEIFFPKKEMFRLTCDCRLYIIYILYIFFCSLGTRRVTHCKGRLHSTFTLVIDLICDRYHKNKIYWKISITIFMGFSCYFILYFIFFIFLYFFTLPHPFLVSDPCHHAPFT